MIFPCTFLLQQVSERPIRCHDEFVVVLSDLPESSASVLVIVYKTSMHQFSRGDQKEEYDDLEKKLWPAIAACHEATARSETCASFR